MKQARAGLHQSTHRRGILEPNVSAHVKEKYVEDTTSVHGQHGQCKCRRISCRIDRIDVSTNPAEREPLLAKPALAYNPKSCDK